MHDDRGKNVKIVTPSIPVEILGLSVAPDAGDQFVEVDEEKQVEGEECVQFRDIYDDYYDIEMGNKGCGSNLFVPLETFVLSMICLHSML